MKTPHHLIKIIRRKNRSGFKIERKMIFTSNVSICKYLQTHLYKS